MAYDLVSGDTGSVLVITIKDSAGVVFDLTGASVVFRWDGETGALVERTATISDAANGKAEYQFAAGELFAPKMNIEVEITTVGGKKITATDLLKLSIREELG